MPAKSRCVPRPHILSISSTTLYSLQLYSSSTVYNLYTTPLAEYRDLNLTRQLSATFSTFSTFSDGRDAGKRRSVGSRPALAERLRPGGEEADQERRREV